MSRDTNFYYSFLVLPIEKRRAIVAVWDFCRAVDDAVDCPKRESSVRSLQEEIGRWRYEHYHCYGPCIPATGEGRHLKPYIGRFQLPRKSFEDLIDGVEMDVTCKRYDTFDQLYQYCLRVASAVGLICIEIFGYRNPRARDYAVALGVALQLTNIVRDVPVDLANGRIYLPQEDLDRFGVSERNLAAGLSEPVAELMAFECNRARAYYSASQEALPNEDARSLVAAEIMSGIYVAILNRIEKQNYDIFSEVVRVPRPRRALIAMQVWARVMTRGSIT
ncbi:MAG: squalene/phytoene synthase family protein [Acidobacteriota bacterium]|nr:squalene/phytoene synthase family protein [Acidobacteriota bacterium]